MFVVCLVVYLCLFTQLQTPEVEFNMNAQEVTDFILSLQRDIRSNQMLQLVLSPLIYPHSSDISLTTLIDPAPPLPRLSSCSDLPHLLLELGYSGVGTREEVLLLLQQFSISDLSPLCVARVIGTSPPPPLGVHSMIRPGLKL